MTTAASTTPPLAAVAHRTRVPSWLAPAAFVLALTMGTTAHSPALANSTDVILESGSSSAASASSMATAKEVLAILNAARAKAGCGPLKINQKLMSAAKTHATNMAKKNFFGHANKDGSKFSKRVKSQGYKYRMVAENIAAGQQTARQAATAWLGSAGHRRNILNCKLKDTGIAVAYQADDQPINGNSKPYYYYWVQVFASP